MIVTLGAAVLDAAVGRRSDLAKGDSIADLPGHIGVISP
jgi:hypothetical protein